VRILTARSSGLRGASAASVALALAACAARPRSVEERWSAWADERFGPAEVGERAALAPSPAHRVQPAHPAESPAEPDGRLRALAPRLERTHVAFTLDGVASLRAALAPLAAQGLPIVVQPRAERAAADAGAVFALDLARPIRARAALDLVVAMAGGDVAWTLRDDVVLVTTAADVRRSAAVLRVYDVRPLTLALTDFRAPELGGRGLVERDEQSFGGVDGTVVRHDADDVLALIEETVRPGTWGADGTSLRLVNGLLFVRHVPAAQLEVLRVLAALR
jgi:hypothetical protein